MKIARCGCLFTALMFPSLLPAHGPTPKKAVESIEIGAPPEAVWTAVKNFGNIAQWHPLVAKSSEESADDPSASRRTLILKRGGQIVESLDTYDEASREYSYRLAKENVEAFPVSFYTATLKVSPGDGGSVVEWKSRFYRGDTGNFPPEHLNDEAAVKAMSEFFKTGLEGLKKRVEEP